MNGREELEKSIISHEDPEELPIKFYYKYYIVMRYTPWRIRLFSMNPCLPKNFSILGTVTYENSSDILQFVSRRTERTCPFDWDVNCFYNSYFFEANITKVPNSLNIYIRKRRIEFKNFKIVRIEKKRGLTVIVAPVYFYSHIFNIFLFFEAWRAQGATKFLVFYHSGTKETRQILNYYQELGLVEIIPWSGFGDLPKYIRNRYPEVDSSVCRNSQTLAQNIAVLEVDTDLATSVDFDEIIASENMTTEENVRKEFQNNPNVGAAYFRHYYVQFYPKINTFNYEGVTEPVFLDKTKAIKFIFNSSVVDNIDVHSVSSFINHDHRWDISNLTALLHYRNSAYSDNSTKVHLNIKIFPDNSTRHLYNIKNDLEILFGTLPKINSKLSDDLDKCFDNLEKIKECRSLVYFCKPTVMKRGEAWDFETTPPELIFL